MRIACAAMGDPISLHCASAAAESAFAALVRLQMRKPTTTEIEPIYDFGPITSLLKSGETLAALQGCQRVSVGVRRLDYQLAAHAYKAALNFQDDVGEFARFKKDPFWKGKFKCRIDDDDQLDIGDLVHGSMLYTLNATGPIGKKKGHRMARRVLALAEEGIKWTRMAAELEERGGFQPSAKNGDDADNESDDNDADAAADLDNGSLDEEPNEDDEPDRGKTAKRTAPQDAVKGRRSATEPKRKPKPANDKPKSEVDHLPIKDRTWKEIDATREDKDDDAYVVYRVRGKPGNVRFKMMGVAAENPLSDDE